MPEDITIWSDGVAEKLAERKKDELVCEGMWTPSGFFHIGNARPEIFTPYAVKHSLESLKRKVKQNLILDDFDAVRKIPGNLGIPENEYDNYLGFPCAIAPSPLPGFKTWGDAFISQVKKFLPEFGVQLTIISVYEQYKQGLFNEWITFALEHAKEITAVWKKVSGTDKEDDFVPLQVVCQSCGKIYYTKVISWNGKEVEYACTGDKGCTHTGKVSPFNGNAKLHWRVHWVSAWLVNNVDFESAGKDHFSKGGSVDVGQALMKEVYNQTPPVQVLTEFLQLKGKKMSGSVGNVIDLEQWLKVAPPELFRFLNFSYKSSTVIEFSLQDNSFILLWDRFERAERIFYDLEEAENEKMNAKLKRVYELSMITKKQARLIQVPFSFCTFVGSLFNPETQVPDALTLLKKTKHIPENITAEETELLKAKLLRARYWVETYADESLKIQFLETKPELSLTNEQKAFFTELTAVLPSLADADTIQQTVFDSTKKMNVLPKDAFALLYQVLIGKTKGPRAGMLIIALGKEKVIARLNEYV